MPYPDDELIMISALQHYVFCPRQCALIHVEQAWSENYLTATGSLLHNRVDRVEQETRRDVHLATSLRLLSHELGLTGIADMVEYHGESQEFDHEGLRIATSLPSRKGFGVRFPSNTNEASQRITGQTRSNCAHKQSVLRKCTASPSNRELCSTEHLAGELMCFSMKNCED